MGWVRCNSDVRKDCPLSSSLCNLYMSDVTQAIEPRQGKGMLVKFRGEDGNVQQDIPVLLYVDGVALVATSGKEMLETPQEADGVSRNMV